MTSPADFLLGFIVGAAVTIGLFYVASCLITQVVGPILDRIFDEEGGGK